MKTITTGSNPTDVYEVQLCTITVCNTSTNLANAKMLKGGIAIAIDLSITPSNILVYPQVGEVWYVKRFFAKWILEARHNYQNPSLNVAANPGDMVIASSGTVHVNPTSMSLTSSPDISLGEPVTRAAGSAKGMMLPVTDSTTGALLGYIQLMN